jgi:hypothetical protein
MPCAINISARRTTPSGSSKSPELHPATANQYATPKDGSDHVYSLPRMDPDAISCFPPSGLALELTTYTCPIMYCTSQLSNKRPTACANEISEAPFLGVPVYKINVNFMHQPVVKARSPRWTNVYKPDWSHRLICIERRKISCPLKRAFLLGNMKYSSSLGNG